MLLFIKISLHLVISSLVVAILSLLIFHLQNYYPIEVMLFCAHCIETSLISYHFHDPHLEPSLCWILAIANHNESPLALSILRMPLNRVYLCLFCFTFQGVWNSLHYGFYPQHWRCRLFYGSIDFVINHILTGSTNSHFSFCQASLQLKM